MSNLFFSDYGDKSKTEQACDYIEQAITVIKNKEKELSQALSGTDKKIQSIKPANLMGAVSSINYYKDKSIKDGKPIGSYGWFTTNNNVEQTCNVAKQHADALLAESKAIHDQNLPSIEINKAIEATIRSLFVKVGIQSTYSTYDYFSSSGRRTRNKQEHTHTAGYIQDLNRSVKTSDGFEQAEKDYSSFIQRIEDYRKEEQKKEQDALRIKQTEEQAKIDTEQLATLRVKYKCDYSASWKDILDAVISSNKYLELGYWLERQRNSWHDGFWKAERGLERFKVETPQEQNIYDSLNSILETAEDGREFRDCQYNYDYLYSMINDETLYNDYRLVMNKIADDLD